MRRVGLKWLVLTSVLAGVAFVLASTSYSGHHGLLERPVAGSAFSISGPTTPPVLYPGAQASALPLTITNTSSAPIYVTSLTVAFTNAFPVTCPASNFEVNGVVLAGSTPGVTIDLSSNQFTVPAEINGTPGTATYPATLGIIDTNTPQDGCQNLNLAMSFSGTAQYSVLTTTTLTSAQDPGNTTATLTATVAPDITPASAASTPGPSDGTVTFYQCADAACSSGTPLTTAPLNTSGVATATVTLSTGAYQLYATFNPTDKTTFVQSTSPTISQAISLCVTTPTNGASHIITGTYSGNWEVTSGTSLWLNGGTINGNVTVDSGGQFGASGGTIYGNVQSSGGPVALLGTTVKGNVQSQNGALALGPLTTIGGNAQAQGGGPFCSEGNPAVGTQKAMPVQVRGNLQGQGLTSGSTSSVCATTVGNNLQWQSNASPSLIGSCGGNTILGNLIVQANARTLTIGASNAGGITNSNATTGNIIIQSNTGGGTLTNNTAGGNCLLQSNKPGIVGTGNSAKGPNQCNTGSAGA